MSIPLRFIPECPPEFAAEFIAGGWRRVERIYNARTDLLLKWIEMSGGEDLHRLRREHMRANGLGAHARAGGNRTKPSGVDATTWPAR